MTTLGSVPIFCVKMLFVSAKRKVLAPSMPRSYQPVCVNDRPKIRAKSKDSNRLEPRLMHTSLAGIGATYTNLRHMTLTFEGS
jgi:hypothetical protein